MMVGTPKYNEYLSIQLMYFFLIGKEIPSEQVLLSFNCAIEELTDGEALFIELLLFLLLGRSIPRCDY